jgi:hypothetical protein
METGLQIAFAIQFALFGVAHLLRPGPLIQFYGVLHSKGQAGVLLIALLSLVTGSLLVAFHNIWTGIPIVLTIFGWAQLAKGAGYLLFPEIGLRQIARVTPSRTNLFRIPGIPFLVMAALLAWHVVRNA